MAMMMIHLSFVLVAHVEGQSLRNRVIEFPLMGDLSPYRIETERA